MSEDDSPFIRHAKNEARKIRKAQPELTHAQALELASKQLGFNTYAHLRAGASKDREVNFILLSGDPQPVKDDGRRFFINESTK